MSRPHRIRGVSPLIQERALELRRRMTPAEQVLWQALRRKEIGIRFRRQHPVGRSILDFYAPACKLVVELDGPIHAYQRKQDEARTRRLEEYGYTVIRFRNDEVLIERLTLASINWEDPLPIKSTLPCTGLSNRNMRPLHSPRAQSRARWQVQMPVKQLLRF